MGGGESSTDSDGENSQEDKENSGRPQPSAGSLFSAGSQSQAGMIIVAKKKSSAGPTGACGVPWAGYPYEGLFTTGERIRVSSSRGLSDHSLGCDDIVKL